MGIIAVALCLLVGCSMRKQAVYGHTALYTGRETVTNRERQLRYHEQLTKDNLGLEYANNIIEIVPVGSFRLSADSGYVGQAERVVISHESVELHAAASDSMASTTARSSAVAAAREHIVFERDTLIKYQEIGASPRWKVPWWMWIVGLGVAFYLIRGFRVR